MKKLFFTLILTVLSYPLWAQGAIRPRIPEGFEAFVARVAVEWKLPGMVVTVVKDGETVFLKGYGKTSLDETGVPVDEHTQFVIASTSKAITAALLATVIDDGHVRWNDTVANHLPDFKLYDPWVTQNFLVRDIMVHKTGFNAYAADNLPSFGYDRDELIKLYRHIRPSHSFRTTYAYNNSLYTVSAQLVEKYTGKSWDDALIERLFTPLEMKNSTTGNKAFFSSPTLARGYRLFKEADTINVAPRTDFQGAFTWLSAIAPAGFVISTGADMANWLKMLLGKGSYNGVQIISERNFRYLITPQTITGSDSVTLNNYAQGWTIEQGPKGRLIRHTGLAYGYTALVGFVPEQNMGFAVLTTNGTTNSPHYAIGRQLIDMYLGINDRDWQKHYLDEYMKPAAPRAPEPARDSLPPLDDKGSYVGIFDGGAFGEARVYIQNDTLRFALKKVDSPLRHRNGNTFTFNLSTGGRSDLTFFTDESQKRVVSLSLNIGDPVEPFIKKE
ncbi:MAG: beta-lactamase family protein [Bacteroidales bacterium]|nr:beta-lactamase family protein [Bacteroidales bacterium]MCL2738491.1 beta-lactamase family protein [Bacteroidales bacterium]